MQLATLDDREWLWLRLLAMNQTVDRWNALALSFADRDGEGRVTTPQEAAATLKAQIEQRMSKDAAVAKVHSLIAFGDTLSTEKVEP